MPADRFFTTSSLDVPSIFLEGEEFHHLSRVMRLSAGETVELVNGRGELATAEVAAIDKKKAELKIISHQTAAPPIRSLILAQALTRPAALEWIIEKGTELGVDEFWIFPGDRSGKEELSPAQLKRLETIVISALKQCGRLFLPKIALLPPLREWKPPSGSLFYGDISPQAPALQGPFSNPTVFFIGPEKGFSENETQLLSEKFKARGITLHQNILRAETAALTALSQYSHCKRYLN